jgi:hypothetical protein
MYFIQLYYYIFNKKITKQWEVMKTVNVAENITKSTTAHDLSYPRDPPTT